MHVFVSMGSEDCFVFFSLWILIALCVFFSMGSEDGVFSEDYFVCFCLYGF